MKKGHCFIKIQIVRRSLREKEMQAIVAVIVLNKKIRAQLIKFISQYRLCCESGWLFLPLFSLPSSLSTLRCETVLDY
jgi:hypothetical protein